MCTEILTNVYKWAELYLKGLNSIQDEGSLSKPTMVSPPELVDSVNALILADRKFTIGVISEHLRISVSKVDTIVHNYRAFSNVSCCWMSPKTMQGLILQQEH